MLRLQAILESCGATITEPLTLETRLASLNLDSLGYMQLWMEIADSDFPINALFDADITEWNLRDVLYFSELQQRGKQKIFQRRLHKSELPFVISKCLECGNESGSAVVALAKSLKVAYKHSVCEGFYVRGGEQSAKGKDMRDCKRERLPSRAEVNSARSLKLCDNAAQSASLIADLQSAKGKDMRDCKRDSQGNTQCLGFFIAFVQQKHIYIPIVWIDSAHQNKAITLLMWRNLAPLLSGRTLTAPMWAKQHFARYVIDEKDDIVTLDSEMIVERFSNKSTAHQQRSR